MSYITKKVLKMQTRISVYKLYTKSKALYIQIRRAAVSLLIKFKPLNYSLVGQNHFSIRATRVSYEAWRHLTRQDFVFSLLFFTYKVTNALTLTFPQTNVTYTHYIHNTSMAPRRQAFSSKSSTSEEISDTQTQCMNQSEVFLPDIKALEFNFC